MNLIEIRCCGDCPFYDEEAMYCIASGSLYLDNDVDTSRYEIPNNCPLPISIVAIKELTDEH